MGDVGGGSTRVIEIVPWDAEKGAKPIAFNLSYSSIEVGKDGILCISGASGLTGSTDRIVTRVPSAGHPKEVSVNEHSYSSKAVSCPGSAASGSCAELSVSFAGSASLRHNARASPAPKASNAWHNSTIKVTTAMLEQLHNRQSKYNISWNKEDVDASWLIPSRLLLYPYVTRPTPSLAEPMVFIDGHPAEVAKQYNSRGNHAVVPAGGGAVSGNTARTFLGWYVDCSNLKPDVSHDIALHFPWSNADFEAHPFLGLFWHNIKDGFTAEVTGGQGDVTIFV